MKFTVESSNLFTNKNIKGFKSNVLLIFLNTYKSNMMLVFSFYLNRKWMVHDLRNHEPLNHDFCMHTLLHTIFFQCLIFPLIISQLHFNINLVNKTSVAQLWLKSPYGQPQKYRGVKNLIKRQSEKEHNKH